MDRSEFWKQVHDEWVTDTDGIDIPTIEPIKPIDIDDPSGEIIEEMDDIFAELGLD